MKEGELSGNTDDRALALPSLNAVSEEITMSAFETYIRDLQEISATGAAVKETSYYGALEKLLNELGKTLKPKVRRVMQLKNIDGRECRMGDHSPRVSFRRRQKTCQIR